MEQRQPVLHAGMAAAFADRLVERVVGGGAERLHIAGAEAADGLAGELKFRDRHQIERAQRIHRALRLGIEGADRLQRVAEEVEPHRIAACRADRDRRCRRAPRSRRLAHRRGAVIAVELQPLGHAVHRQHVAGRGRQRLRRDQAARRHALQRGIDGGKHDARPLAAFQAGEARQRGHALRHDAGMRRHAVVGQAVPGRETR